MLFLVAVQLVATSAISNKAIVDILKSCFILYTQINAFILKKVSIIYFNKKNINNPNFNKKIIIAPLDWGLGHATRCIPIINEFLAQQFQVYIAAEGAVGYLLQNEFPNLTHIPLQGYRVKYSQKGKYFAYKILWQIPGIVRRIIAENRWLHKVINQYGITHVLSDNRYGLYNKSVHSIFLTHQLYILTGYTFLNKIVQQINYFFIEKYNQCWVIDFAEAHNLAGLLSHPTRLPKVPVTYLSALSRFTIQPTLVQVNLLVVLSGPEPQRTILEKIILPQLTASIGSVVLVRGLPNHANQLSSPLPNVSIINYLPAAELNQVVMQAKVVISRSGYTSIMDYAGLQKKVVYIPTPGQTEQNYLAQYIAQNNYGLMANQHNFNLNNALQNINNSNFTPYPSLSNTCLKQAIAQLV